MFVGIGLGTDRLGKVGSGASLNLNFTSAIPGGVTVVSSPAGYAPTSSGTLTAFTANAGRRTDLGLMVEPAATNICLQSQTLDNGTWSRTNLSGVTADTTAAPDGTTTAEKLVEDGLTNAHAISQIITTTAAPYTFSAYIKPAGRNFCALYETSAAKGSYFNVSSPAALGILNGTPTSVRITALGNGWCLCEITLTLTASSTVNIFDSINGSAFNYGGDGSSGVYAWGAQLELGTKATSAITTTTASATRTAENIQFTVPAGITNLTYTFDDNSTQLVSGVSAGTYTIPTNLNRPQIKTIVGS